MSTEKDVVNWNEVKVKLKKKYAQLNNADLDWRDTNEDDLLKTIANNLGITVKEIREVISIS